jgi:hypothetical protein
MIKERLDKWSEMNKTDLSRYAALIEYYSNQLKRSKRFSIN